MDTPAVKLGDWISINGRDCVIALIREPGDSLGFGEVVFSRDGNQFPMILIGMVRNGFFPKVATTEATPMVKRDMPRPLGF
jgi:hypothetical protein